MTPGIFKESDNDLIASETLREILKQSESLPPAPPTPIEIQRDMVKNPRFKVDHGPTENFKHGHPYKNRIRLDQPIVDEEWLVS